MTAPLCVVCHRTPVRVRRWGREPARGLRLLDGQSWNWFCSKRCSGRDAGRTNITSGRVRVAIAKAQDARREGAANRQRAEVADEVRVLIGYGVPKPVAIATLTRLVQRARAQMKDAMYHEYVRKPKLAGTAKGQAA